VGRLQIAVLLQLVSIKTIVDTAHISDSKAISALDLKPYLAPFNGGGSEGDNAARDIVPAGRKRRRLMPPPGKAQNQARLQRVSRSAPDRTRTCDLLLRSPSDPDGSWAGFAALAS
jgi:hypothetical protein